MRGPSFRMQLGESVEAGGPNLGTDAGHVQSQIVVEEIVKVRLGMKESKTHLGSEAASIVELRLRPAATSRPELQSSLTEILLQRLERALHTEKLDNRRCLHPPPLVLKFRVPTVCRPFSCKVCRPPGSWGRFEIGLHVCPAVTLNFQNASRDGSLKASPCRSIVLLQSIEVGELLGPGGRDPF